MTADPDARRSARLLLGDALADNRPIRPEVREALNRLLDAMAISEDRLYTPDIGELTAEQQVQTDGWHAAAWRGAAKRYRQLLVEVREHGVSGAREGVPS